MARCIVLCAVYAVARAQPRVRREIRALSDDDRKAYWELVDVHGHGLTFSATGKIEPRAAGAGEDVATLARMGRRGGRVLGDPRHALCEAKVCQHESPM